MIIHKTNLTFCTKKVLKITKFIYYLHKLKLFNYYLFQPLDVEYEGVGVDVLPHHSEPELRPLSGHAHVVTNLVETPGLRPNHSL